MSVVSFFKIVELSSYCYIATIKNVWAFGASNFSHNHNCPLLIFNKILKLLRNKSIFLYFVSKISNG